MEKWKETREFIKTIKNKIGEELIKLYSKSNVVLLADVFEQFIKLH